MKLLQRTRALPIFLFVYYNNCGQENEKGVGIFVQIVN